MKRTANLEAFIIKEKSCLYFIGRKKKFLALFLGLALVLVFSGEVRSQSTDFRLNTRSYELLDQIAVQSEDLFFTSVKPYSRKKGHHLAYSFDGGNNKKLSYNRNFLLMESREYLGDSLFGAADKPFLGAFYKYRSDLVSVSNEDFDLHVNPVGELGVGYDADVSSPLFVNTRGIDIRGTIDNKVSFYTFIHENQLRLASYVQNVQDTVGIIPYEGFWKEFGGDAYDFLRAQGYVDFGVTKHISAQFGFGRHFIGNGKRSLILSDFSNSYPYLRLTIEVWKIKYTNIFAEMVADVFFFEGGTLGSQSYPKKYFALHHLDIAITDDFHLGLFESVLHGRPDSLGGTDFQPEYLNPIIFYGAAEQQDGSADNVIVGMDFSWDLWKKMQLYGQFTLDELVISELLSNSGWWGNKYGFQLGLKHFDFIVPTLNWQVEFNQARPFTYAHDGDFTSYTHYRQPLAHPLGANFRELLITGNFQPLPKLVLEGTMLFADYGSGPVGGFSIGRDPLINTKNRGVGLENDFDNRQGQGIASNLALFQFTGSYQLMHNLFFDVQLIRRVEDREGSPSMDSNIFFSGLRWNIARRNYLF